MGWNAGLTELREILSELYETIALSKQVVDLASLPTGSIKFNSAATTNWHFILTEAHKHRKVSAVVAEAGKDFPKRKDELAHAEQHYQKCITVIRNGNGIELPPVRVNNKKLIQNLAPRVKHKRCMPLLSHFVSSSALFPDLNQNALFQDPLLAAAWSESEAVDYPMAADKHIMPRVAQYVYTMVQPRDDYMVNLSYLDFVKDQLLKEAEERGKLSPETIKKVRDDKSNRSVTEVALTLKIFEPGRYSDDVLSRLARLPFDIYLTTTPFALLEEALRENGKPDYVSARYHWSEDDVNPEDIIVEHKPTKDKPLVYHLHGLETEITSLVLTEDNYFKFFKQLAQDLRNEVQSNNRLPMIISKMLGSRSLILLGYSLVDWSFRSFFRGPFRQSVNARTSSVSAQFPPDEDKKRDEKIRNYLTEFFRDDRFDLYWGGVKEFVIDLEEEIG